MIHGQIKPLFNTPINWGHPLAQGLVLSMLMNEGMGDLVHDSVGMNDGRTSGMAPMSGTSGWVPGPHGAALAFDGSNDYVNCGNKKVLDFGTEDFTIILSLIFPMAGTNVKGILFKGDWANGRTGTWGFAYWNSLVQYRDSKNTDWEWNASLSYATFPTSGVHIFALTRVNGTSYRKYYNGKPDGAIYTSPAVAALSNTGVLQINSGLVSFSASSLSIYNRALSAEEIAYLYAFPWCMYDQATPAWAQKDYGREARLANYYQQMRAA